MIKSMTGFGRAEAASTMCKITVEIKAVNHRYCDISVKIPKLLNYLETDVRNYLKKKLNRGKIDVYICYENLLNKAACVKVNEELGREYYEAMASLSNNLGIANDATASKIIRFPDVYTLEEQEMDTEALEAQVMEAVEEAVAQFNESRLKEGANLSKDIIGKIEGMQDNITIVEERYPQMVADYRSKLEDKVHELLSDTSIDESRIATEVVLYADKICVDEETVRLRSHIDNMKDVLMAGGNVGRKLDFISQEMNREANTILSKANDIKISNVAIDIKTEIEKIREQVQNIE